MKKKNYEEDSENEFEVDEPEELQENSDEDWAPKKGKRASTGKGRKTPNKKAKKDTSEDEGDEEEEAPKKKKKPAAKPKATPKAKPKGKKAAKDDSEESEEEEEPDEDQELDEEEEVEDEEEDEDEEDESTGDAANQKTPKEFSSGAFVVLKSEFDAGGNPPLWKIDGKALLQKYTPFEQDGKTLYKNTSVYSGWSIANKNQYYPVTVQFKQQTRKEHIVEFQRHLIQKDDAADE